MYKAPERDSRNETIKDYGFPKSIEKHAIKLSNKVGECDREIQLLQEFRVECDVEDDAWRFKDPMAVWSAKDEMELLKLRDKTYYHNTKDVKRLLDLKDNILKELRKLCYDCGASSKDF